MASRTDCDDLAHEVNASTSLCRGRPLCLPAYSAKVALARWMPQNFCVGAGLCACPRIRRRSRLRGGCLVGLPKSPVRTGKSTRWLVPLSAPVPPTRHSAALRAATFVGLMTLGFLLERTTSLCRGRPLWPPAHTTYVSDFGYTKKAPRINIRGLWRTFLKYYFSGPTLSPAAL